MPDTRKLRGMSIFKKFNICQINPLLSEENKGFL